MTTTPASAAIYCRISRDTEGLGLGVERQEYECRQLADRLGLDVATVFTDNDISAYKGKRRPGFEQCVDAMKAGMITTLLAWHPDRLTRSPVELEGLIDLLDGSGVSVHTVSAGTYDLSTPAGRLQARIVGSTARYESEQKAARQKSKSDELARDGKAPGGRPPFGYDRAPGTYVVNQTEAQVVERIVREVLQGSSLLSIAKALNHEHVPTREGRPWHHSTVRAVALNPATANLRVHRRQVVGEGNWPAIIERELHDELRLVLADPARKRKAPSKSYPLSGLLRSADDVGMIGRVQKGRRTYVAVEGKWVSIDADKVEAEVFEQVLSVLDTVALPAAPAVAGDVAMLEAELEELAKLRGEGVISLGEWVAAREPLVDRIESARAHRRGPAPVDTLSVPGAVRDAWPLMAPDARRVVLEAVVDHVTVLGAEGRGRWSTVPDRLRVHWRV